MINNVLEILATIIDVLFYTWFIPNFNGSSIKKKPALLVFPALLLTYQLIADQFLKGFDLIYMAGVLLFSIVFSLCFNKCTIIWRIFTAFMYPIILILSETFIYVAFPLFVKHLDLILQYSDFGIRSLFLLLWKAVQYAFFNLILCIFKKNKILDLKKGIFSFIFTISTAIGLGTLVDVTYLNLPYEGKVLVITLTMSFLLLNIMFYIMIYQLHKLFKNKYKLMLAEERIKFDALRIEETKNIWCDIRKIKHDMQNHMDFIGSQLDAENIESCKQYISKISTSIKSLGDIIQSGNSVIDYLVNTKLTGLDDVKVEVSGYVSDYSDIDDVDLSSILGNILDNAVEAQKNLEGNKKIELCFFQKNSNRIIVCKNTANPSALKNNKELNSTKNRSDFHGLGHQIVQTKVEKYQGIVIYFEEENMFGVQIIIPIKEPIGFNLNEKRS